MDEIKELIKIVTDNTKKNVPLLDLKNQHQNGNKEMNLFLGIKNGDFSNDEEASQGIYGSEEVDFKFRMLKSRLNRKLLNHLFFMDFTSSKYTKSTSYYQEVLDYFHFARMLLNIGEVKLGSKILQKAIDLAREGEFTSILKDCLRELRKVYAQTYRPKLFQSIKDQINEVEVLERLEEGADEIFQEIRLYINSSVTNRKKNFDPYEEAIAHLEKVYQKTNSYNVFEKYFMLKIWYHELSGEFDKVLDFVNEIEKNYSRGKLNQKRLDHLFINTAKGNALIKLKKFDEGIAFLEKMLKEIDSASSDWYFFAERYVMLHIQNEQFDKASEVYLRVVGNKSFRELSEREAVRWSIICSYLYFFTRNRKLIKKFDYKQFIHNTPDFVKENAGYHVSILILQIIEGIDGELEKLYSKLNALDDYVSRYLNNSFSKRTKTFCKLLHKIAMHNRDYETITSKSRYLQDKLHESEITGESFVDFEIVPYEFLWVKALEKTKSYK